jgi:hypothetical protein
MRGSFSSLSSYSTKIFLSMRRLYGKNFHFNGILGFPESKKEVLVNAHYFHARPFEHAHHLR